MKQIVKTDIYYNEIEYHEFNDIGQTLYSIFTTLLTLLTAKLI